MPYMCPSCGAGFWRPTAPLSRRPGVKWYRFSPRRVYCPKCRAELKTVKLRAWYLMTAAILVVEVMLLVLFLFHPGDLRWLTEWAVLSAVLVAFGCRLYKTVRYELYAGDGE